MEENELRINIILSLQGALVGNISQHVRGICCDWQSTEWVKLKFYLNIEPNEEERELMSVVLTEFESNIQTSGFQFKKYYEEMIYSTKPFEKLDKFKIVVYWRNENPIF